MTSDDSFKDAYHQSFLLNIFQKLCSKMNTDDTFKLHVIKLLNQSFDQVDTMRSIVLKQYKLELSDADSRKLLLWVEAYRRKKSTRKSRSLEEKKALISKQNGFCLVCGEPLGTDYSKIHIDHIIPWVLVGDELEDNYQALCSTCNECKNSKTDYLFMNMLKLI